jgi:hypothetical protein
MGMPVESNWEQARGKFIASNRDMSQSEAYNFFVNIGLDILSFDYDSTPDKVLEVANSEIAKVRARYKRWGQGSIGDARFVNVGWIYGSGVNKHAS